MKYIKEYLENVIKVKPLGELTTRDEQELNGLSGEMVYIDGKCTDIFISHADYVNWLEGKYEQKPVDNLEQKFKVGDWIAHDRTRFTFKVVDTKPMIITVVNTLGYHHTISTDAIEKNYHLWSIKDAKPGDVLAFDDNNMVMFKNLYNETTFHSYCHIEDGLFDVNRDETPDWWDGEGFHPATKEQRDMLFQKMHEAGYEWDANNKELKKIDWNCYIKFNPNAPSIVDKTTTHQNSWKPSSLDIKILEDVREGKVNPKDYSLTLYCLIDQLKKLKGE